MKGRFVCPPQRSKLSTKTSTTRMNDETTPLKWKVFRWKKEKFAQGAWSQLLMGGSPDDRSVLGSLISNHLVLAGEACETKMPAMVNGAALSGENAVEKLLANCKKTKPNLLIVGAGAAGIFAARHAKKIFPDLELTHVEASDRIGGRVHTVDMALPGEPPGKYLVDGGATWLQQFPDNHLVAIAKEAGLNLISTDFHRSTCGVADQSDISDLNEIVDELADHFVSATDDGDVSVAKAAHEFILGLPSHKKKLAQLALAGDINSDMGECLHETSAKWSMNEPGVGIDDHYLKEGYASLLAFATEGLDIRFNTPIARIDWSNEDYIEAWTEGGDCIRADICICTVPIGVIQNEVLRFFPQLPERHQVALSRMRQGHCDKVVLRFNSRWWPSSEGGLLRWYDNSEYKKCYGRDDGEELFEKHVGGHVDESMCVPDVTLLDGAEFPWVLDWVEWLDLTDGLGVPIVMAFIVGERAIARFHDHRSDDEVAFAAAKALKSFTESIMKRDRTKCPPP